ncbi:ferrous iron transport protein A [Nonlabens spongiae]|uniref:Ferrous iron transport protein A n=1 Tax=Nonlabens spongiae TaxID=331648 RepID=A0A1W6MML3_9FLAO|nr:FeoA family protein [Nonlabens spongiae]ARN78840.1 ferrous iron transport protein A [Nonlabens spongiae]
MSITISQLKRGQSATIKDFDVDNVPLKLLEMGCLPGNTVRMMQSAPFQDPIYLNINDTHLAIRRETAQKIIVDLHG